jgi:hypothetical protein
MIIFASTGPVISVRRRSRAFGSGAIFQSPSRMCRVSGREVGHLAGVDARSWRAITCLQQFLTATFESAVQFGDQSQRSGVRMVS